ncbi:MAG: hypothetical protein PHS84_03840 [Paludibacter sp.]|nr:hypothetical protein [Paludibacter sp.]
MKTIFFSFIPLGFLLCFTSCENNIVNNTTEPIKKEVFSGYVQKGPFINGSSVIISELDAELNQTGRSYSTTVADNSGSYEQKKIELVSNYLQLKADGYYFNEVTGESSSGQLTLYALADISQVNSANVNVLTHLEKSRVEYLVQQKGLAFDVAKKQAQQEVLAIFSLTLPADSTSESLNLSGSGDNNAVLLAVSCILQGPITTADMSELMANISSDIKTDGILDNTSLGSQLIDNALLTNLTGVRQHLVAKYAELGLNNVVIPDFEKYVEEFKTKTKYIKTKFITYPKIGSSGLNILSDSVTVIEPYSSYADPHTFYSMTANLPEGTSLRIILKGNKWYYVAIPVPVNWTVGTYNESTKVQEFTVTNRDSPNNIAMMFEEGTVTIEYYENGATTPTRVKELTVSSSQTTNTNIYYPPTGASGENILSDSVSVTRAGKIYSIKAEVPKGKALRVVLKGGTWVCVNPPAPVNWTIGTYDNVNKSQEFIVTESTKLSDMGITFTSDGTYTIEYYENNATTATRIRTFVRS